MKNKQNNEFENLENFLNSGANYGTKIISKEKLTLIDEMAFLQW